MKMNHNMRCDESVGFQTLKKLVEEENVCYHFHIGFPSSCLLNSKILRNVCTSWPIKSNIMFFSNFEACRAIKVGLEIRTVRVFGNVSH